MIILNLSNNLHSFQLVMKGRHPEIVISPKQGILVSRYPPTYFYLHQISMKNMPCHDEKVFSIVKLHDPN